MKRTELKRYTPLRAYTPLKHKSEKQKQIDKEWAKVVQWCIKYRANYRCEYVDENGERCKNTGNYMNGLEGHHIIPRSKDSEHTKENCEILCTPHHKAAHGEQRVWFKGKLYTYVKRGEDDGNTSPA